MSHDSSPTKTSSNTSVADTSIKTDITSFTTPILKKSEGARKQLSFTKPEYSFYGEIADSEAPEKQTTNEMSSNIDRPAFEKSNVEAWFIAMDYWFKATKQTDDETKFNIVVATQGVLTIPKLKEILNKVPTASKYEYIRTELTAFYGESEQERLNILLSEMPLGDQKPSELFQEMKRVAGNTVTDSALKGLWSRRLPDHARAAVAAATNEESEYTRIADAVVETLQVKQINNINTNQSTSNANADSEPINEIQELRMQVNQLTQMFKETFSQRRGPSNSGSNSRNRSSSRRRRDETPEDSDDQSECWYHWKFGKNSRKCRSPCRHKKTHGTNPKSE